MRMKYSVGLGEKRIPAADYIAEYLGFSKRQAKKLIKDKKVYINGKAAYWDNLLSEGDILEIDSDEESESNIEAEDIALSIIYEDEYILAVNKPPFMLVHPTPNHPGGTLLNAVAYYFEKQGIKSALHLLNRLDMNTSGIVIIPKSAAVHSRLDKMMKDGAIRKFYTAVVKGVIEPGKGIIDKPIGKDEADSVRRKIKSDGQPAVTLYDTINNNGEYSLIRLELLTGRTHQIRVHLSHLGHAIIGDTLYGEESPLIGRQALHASDMELLHPSGGGVIKLHAEVPDDIRKLLTSLKLE